MTEPQAMTLEQQQQSLSALSQVLSGALDQIAILASEVKRLQPLMTLPIITGQMIAEVAIESATPRDRLDEMLSYIEGAISQSIAASPGIAESPERTMIDAMVDAVRGLAEAHFESRVGA